MKDGPFAYGTSYVTGGEQPRYFREPCDGGERSVLLDGDRQPEGKAHFRPRVSIIRPITARQIWAMTTRPGILHPARP